jgi:hypothetical protein
LYSRPEKAGFSSEQQTFSALLVFSGEIEPHLPDIPIEPGSYSNRPRNQGHPEALMYIANGNRRGMIGEAAQHQQVGAVRHETLRQWVEDLLANESFGNAADDLRETVAKKIRPGIA